jgi:two-component system KDP operon response regulator KdpE
MTVEKVLVIDDEPSIRKLLKTALELNGYEVAGAASGGDGLRAVIDERPDVVLLDLGLPDMSGIDVLKRLREWSKLPVIVLTVNDSDEDKVRALDSGADDYLTKPFSTAELMARIRVAARHSSPTEQGVVFSDGPLEIDYSARTVKVSGQTVKLTSTEYDILRVLARHAGKVVTHGFLLREVWGPHSVEHTQYLRVYLGKIRKKLRVNEQSPELIVTESGVGYRLLVDSF